LKKDLDNGLKILGFPTIRTRNFRPIYTGSNYVRDHIIDMHKWFWQILKERPIFTAKFSTVKSREIKACPVSISCEKYKECRFKI
jgi:hypothetical protein